MKKIVLLCFMQIISRTLLFAQGQDAIWYFGDSAGIQFNNNVATSLSNSGLYTIEASSVASDSIGNLLFYAGFIYSGGAFHIWNKENKVMLNDNLINQIQTCATCTQGLLICPIPGDSNKYYLFTEYYFNTSLDLNYHIIDMSLDSGRGAVLSANINLCSNCILSEKMHVIRHANGRDWWLILAYAPYIPNGSSGYFISFLITPNGISSQPNQYIGPGFDYIGQMTFSPIGDKLIVADISGGLNLFDFDRCTGLLSNWNELGYPPYLSTTFNKFYGCSFSPSGRYIYASNRDSVFQYDVLAPNVKASKVLLAKTFHVNDYYLGQHKLGPDGKIYIANFDWNLVATLGLDKFLNVINYPDSAGLACGLSLYSFSLGDKRSMAGMPNIPNYNLGAVVGSMCDSLTGVDEIKNKEEVLVYPNPANKEITIYNSTGHSIKEISIFQMNGKMVYSAKLNANEIIKIKIEDFAEGIYFYSFYTKDDNIQRGKICIIH